MRFMGPGIRRSSSLVVDIVVLARLLSYVLGHYSCVFDQ